VDSFTNIADTAACNTRTFIHDEKSPLGTRSSTLKKEPISMEGKTNLLLMSTFRIHSISFASPFYFLYVALNSTTTKQEKQYVFLLYQDISIFCLFDMGFPDSIICNLN